MLFPNLFFLSYHIKIFLSHAVFQSETFHVFRPHVTEHWQTSFFLLHPTFAKYTCLLAILLALCGLVYSIIPPPHHPRTGWDFVSATDLVCDTQLFVLKEFSVALSVPLVCMSCSSSSTFSIRMSLHLSATVYLTV